MPGSKIKQVIKSITPPVVLDLIRLAASKPRSQPELALAGPDPQIEFVDFYAHTSFFALEKLRERGTPLKEMSLFSLGNKMAHLADYLALFAAVYHNTMLQTEVPVEPDECPSALTILREDFFSLPPLNIDCVISHAAIHCLNDSRYGNGASTEGWQRPYQAAGKLRQIIGDKSIPIIVSIAVHETESFIDDNARLSHEKFVDSFRRAGFSLEDHFFDYLCHGMPFRPEYLETRYRRSKRLPQLRDFPSDYSYVIGNYYFA